MVPGRIATIANETHSPSICIVEDDESAAKALARIISTFGFEARTFGTARLFKESGESDHAQCVILDIDLPDANGFELQEILHDIRPELPIIFATGYGDIPMSVKAMRSGAIDFLQKPVSEDLLFDALTRALAYHTRASADERQRKEYRNRLESLTDREFDVFRCIITGAMNKQIAYHLEISEKTVKVHRGHIMQKLDARSIVEFLQIASLCQIEPDPLLKPRR